jgi:hypothetical protein
MMKRPHGPPYFTRSATSTVADRGDAVFELVEHNRLKENSAGAQFSNDRGTDAFARRGNVFGMQLDETWFISSSSTITRPDGTTEIIQTPAAWSSRKGAAERLGMAVHEGDHANHQAWYDEADKLRNTTPAEYRPELIGAARAAASVDLYMRAEVSGWYADLLSLRADVDAGRITNTEYILRVREGTVAASLSGVEWDGKSQGLTGAALADYVADHAKGALPAS